MANNVFNPKLRNIDISKADTGVRVDESDKYDALLNVAQTGIAAYGNYQVDKAEEEIAELFTNTQDPTGEGEAEAEVLNGARDSIELEKMKAEQGLISQRQMESNVNKIITERTANAPFMSKQLDALKQSSLKTLSGISKQKEASKTAYEKAKEEVNVAAYKKYETLSLNIFGKSTDTLTDEEFSQMKKVYNRENKNTMLAVEVETQRLLSEQSKYNQEKTDKVNKQYSNSIQAEYNNSWNDYLGAVTTSLNKSDLSEDELARAEVNIVNSSNELKKQFSSMYQKATGQPMPQSVADRIEMDKQNALDDLARYKSLSVEERNRAQFKDYKASLDAAKTVAELNNINIESNKALMAVYNDKNVSAIVNAEPEIGYTLASKVYGEADTKRYIKGGDESSFDGTAWFLDKFKTQVVSMPNIEREEGEKKATDLARAAARTPDFGSSNPTNLETEGENKHPQTDAIRHLNNKQNQKADEITNTLGGQVNTEVLDLVSSNLSYYVSNNFKPGVPNTEVNSYKVNNGAIKATQDAEARVSMYIKQNPDKVYVTPEGNVVTDDENVNKILSEIIYMSDKFKDTPGAKEAFNTSVTNIKVAAIESQTAPLIESIDKVLSSPKYDGLSMAQKNELKKQMIQEERVFQQVQGMKEIQTQAVDQLANNLGGQRGGGAAFTTIGILNNIQKSLSPTTPMEERLSSLAYLGLKAESLTQWADNGLTRVSRKLFGDTLEEKVEEAATTQIDKRSGLPRNQVKVLNRLESGKMKPEMADKIYNQIVPLQDGFEEREALGEELNENEKMLQRYYDKFINTYESKRGNIGKDGNTTGIEFTNLGETTNLSEEGAAITEQIIENEVNAEAVPYEMTFNNETSRGKVDSRELHVPSNNSGVTLGAGYDMKDRTPDEIVTDLIAVGVSQEDAQRISQGAGLTGDEAEAFADANDDIELTDGQEKALFKEVITRYEERAKGDYERLAIDNKPSYDELPNEVKELLVDYSYNVGVSEFPVFFEAIISGDKETAMKEYKRYTDGKPLGRRNKDTLSFLKDYNFNKLN